MANTHSSSNTSVGSTLSQQQFKGTGSLGTRPSLPSREQLLQVKKSPGPKSSQNLRHQLATPVDHTTHITPPTSHSPQQHQPSLVSRNARRAPPQHPPSTSVPRAASLVAPVRSRGPVRTQSGEVHRDATATPQGPSAAAPVAAPRVFPHPSWVPRKFSLPFPPWHPDMKLPILSFDQFLALAFYPLLYTVPAKEQLWLYCSITAMYFSRCPPGAALAYVTPAGAPAAAFAASCGAAAATATQPAAATHLLTVQNMSSPQDLQSFSLSGFASLVGGMGGVSMLYVSSYQKL